MSEPELFGVAIVGLAGRFPQAPNLDDFWQMLHQGTEAIETFSDAALLAEGVDAELLQHPDYVKAGAIIPDVDTFDAHFFNMSAQDAAITDPQQRLFIECVWQALEQAGYPPATTPARIGLYAGSGENSYQQYYLEPNKAELLATVGDYRLLTLSSKDFLATRTAYLLNLTGPVMTIQTACSTSLVAVHVACQSLLNFECDLALAGGVSITVPQKQGYLYQPGMIMSKDGHCRAFDACAQGTATGSGVGVVLLKRVEEALADGDTIYAVIRGSAVNNDGSSKMGYTAPSVKGQTEVILEAQAAAGVHPDDISYIEAHGTGTPLGDPIEIQALTQAFRRHTQRQGYCALGSVKTNIGHADTAAGIAGLLKTVLALKHRQIPPSLHFEHPNPHIDFVNSPFFVNDRLRLWDVEGACAGVSSFGIGGTNAHVIVAQAPAGEPSSASRPLQLMTLSAKTATALKTATQNLVHWLRDHTHSTLADVAYTLNCGRQSFSYRQSWVCAQMDEAISQLTAPAPSYQAPQRAPEVAFLFPGQGSQYPQMTQSLYETEPLFRERLDYCATVLTAHLKHDLRDVLYSGQNSTLLTQTRLTQPAMFVVEYALAQLWMHWGIKPQALLGHSLGEYVAACLAGVFSLEEALALVAARGQLIQSLPPGAMLALPLSEAAVQPWLTPQLSLAAVNGRERCVLAGEPATIGALQHQLHAQGIESRLLQTAHGFHSHLMTPILADFKKLIQQVKLNTPQRPYLSNVTGTWIRPEQATDPAYWVQHLRHPVRFNDNVQALLQHDILLEVGPGHTLSALARQQYSDRITVLSSLPQKHPGEIQHILSTLGQLWAHGVNVDWAQFYAGERRHRLPLPTYPFERKRYWIDRPYSIPRPAAQDEHISMRTEWVTPTPQTPLEQQLATIWQTVLGMTTIGVDDDFFELGGDSLLAIQLATQLRTKLGVQVGPQAVLKAPTIAQLAQLLQQTPTTPTELLVELKSGHPQQPPLFLIHPIGGHVFSYRALAQNLKIQRPIYALQAPGISGQVAPVAQIKAMAAQYLQHLRKRQPQGPYFLGGFSFGGAVAYEMAQQFTHQGENIALLTLMDTPTPGHLGLHDDVDIMATYILEIGKDMQISVAELRQMAPHSRWRWLAEKIHGDKTALEQTQRDIALFHAHLQALSDYQPQPWQGKAIFFRALASQTDNREKTWAALIPGGMELYFIGGDHFTMLQHPHVQQLAQQLQLWLNSLPLS